MRTLPLTREAYDAALSERLADLLVAEWRRRRTQPVPTVGPKLSRRVGNALADQRAQQELDAQLSAGERRQADQIHIQDRGVP
ncbi:MAG TPA: hypothetical protein VES67_14015 [Vicinamibacterales bacterium]|nr:hypothetical protein [Vicinamibacterales bacterium]